MKKMNWAGMIVIAALLSLSAGKAAAQDKAPDASKPSADAVKPAADAPAPPETIVFDKTSKMPQVSFPHAAHNKRYACKECHGGDSPLFPQKKDKDQPGMKMADFYAGKQCGACHDGKKIFDGKPIFAAKSGCMKCHKKPAQ